MTSQISRWSIFCAVVDNYGDLGVCLRLARQVRAEYSVDVTLWVDDAATVESFLRVAWNGKLPLQHEGVVLRLWQRPWPLGQEVTVADCGIVEREIAESEVIVEAFGCDLPVAIVEAMAQRERRPLWINLEYLSAESWVDECHLLRSLLAAGHGKALNRIFFFPGFTAATGGLLREQGLLQRHAAWQQDESRAREQLFSELGLPGRLSEGTALISVFTYESASIPNWFRALSDSSAPVCCLVPQGRVVAAVADSFERRQLLPGDVLVQGALTVVILPFLSQDDYDRLLSVCDFNLVRGEDSFVRAQWAARPLLWHIYPQDDEAHLIKLQAFLDLYGAEDQGAGDSHQALTAMSRFWLAWNRGEDCRDLWHHLRPQLPSLREHARKWQLRLAKSPDLAANLLQLQRDWQHEQCMQRRGQ